MKKLFLLSYVMLSSVVLLAQVDSAQIIDGIGLGFGLVQTIAPHEFIKGIDNNIVASVVTLLASAIIGFIHRRKTIRNWKKQGKLND